MNLSKLVVLGFLFGISVQMLGQNSSPTKGKDFWLGFMQNVDQTGGNLLDVFIVGDNPTSGTISVPGQSWSQSFNVNPNNVTTVSIPSSVAEVFSQAMVEGKGVHIETADTVAVFAVNARMTSADATKILPTPTLGYQYMVSAYKGFNAYSSEMLIVATEDDTEIEIIPSCDLYGFAPGTDDDFTITLDAGQVYRLVAAIDQDLTGTVIQGTENSGACRPFAVFSGAICANIPVACANCDHVFEENLPVSSWGTEYFVTPFVYNLNPIYGVAQPNYTYRILASEDNTSVSIDGTASYTLNAGQFAELQYVVGAHCVTANKPIAVTQFMEGITCGGNGDPSMVILDDADKKINQITFSTVESTILTNHYVNIVVATEDVGTVTLDGNPIAATSFQSFPNCTTHMWVGFAIAEGSHTLESPNGVNGYVYGTGDSESYAYSVGSFKPEPPIEYEDAICANGSVQLSVSNQYFDPVWYNVQDMSTPVFSGYVFDIPVPVSSAVYVAVVNENASGCEAEFYYSVEDINAPGVHIEPASAAICRYESVQLNVVQDTPESTYNFAWSPSLGLSDPTIANPIATPYSTTTYTVTVSTPTGCAATTQNVTINVSPGSISHLDVVSSDPYICDGETVQMETEVESVIWSDNFDPNISLGDWTSIHNGTASSVCGSVSGTALYFNGTGERSATTLPLDVSNGGTIYFNIKIANGTFPCDNAEPGDNVELRYSLDGVTFPAANTIMVLYESAYPEFTLVSVDIPAAAQSASTYFKWMQVGSWVGNQDNWSLDEVYIGTFNESNFTVAWTPSATLDLTDQLNPIASPSESTNYIISITDNASGCVYDDSLRVIVATPFELNLPATISKCDAQSITLDADPSITDSFAYVWNSSNGELSNSGIPQPVVNPNSTATYSVEVTSSEGCVEEAEVEVLVSTVESISINIPENPYCENENALIESAIVGSSNNVTYQWSGVGVGANETQSSLQYSTSETTDISLEVTEPISGCVYNASEQIQVYEYPVVTILPESVTACDVQGMPVEGSTSYAGTMTWTWAPANAVADAAAQSTTITTNTSTTLELVGTNEAGCSGSAQIEITVQTAITDLGADQDACVGEVVTLDTGWPATYAFQWDHGPTTPAVLITQSGIYHVQVTTPEGCVSEDQVEITFHEVPVVNLGFDVAGCIGESVTLDAGNPGLMYDWSNGSQSQIISVTEPDNYIVVVSNGFCSDVDDINVFFNPIPENPFDDEVISFCFSLPPYIVRLDAQNEGSTFVWDDSSEGQIYNATQPGVYTVDISTDFGCTASYSAIIQEECPGAIYAPNAFTPDGDGLNDVWVVEGYNINTYNLRIWNRWGELMFETNSLKRPWLGQRRDGDEYVEAGVYHYRITYTIDLGEKGISEEMEIDGQVTLIR